jgi:hypothetical protein
MNEREATPSRAHKPPKDSSLFSLSPLESTRSPERKTDLGCKREGNETVGHYSREGVKRRTNGGYRMLQGEREKNEKRGKKRTMQATTTSSHLNARERSVRAPPGWPSHGSSRREHTLRWLRPSAEENACQLWADLATRTRWRGRGEGREGRQR